MSVAPRNRDTWCARPPGPISVEPPTITLCLCSRGALHHEIRGRLRRLLVSTYGAHAAQSGLRGMRGARGDRWVVVAADLLRALHRRDPLVDAQEWSRLDRLDGPSGRHGEGEGGCLLAAREVGKQDE